MDPDQPQRFVGPDLGPICLQRLLAKDTSKQVAPSEFFHVFCHLLNFFNVNFSEKFFQEYHECQTIWNLIRPDKMSGLIWVQSVCKGYQQRTLVSNELKQQIYQYVSIFWLPVLSRGSMIVCLICLFDLILYVPSTIFQLNRDGSSWVEPVLS